MMQHLVQVVRDRVARYTDEALVAAIPTVTEWIATGDAPADAAVLLRIMREEMQYRAAEDAALMEPAV